MSKIVNLHDVIRGTSPPPPCDQTIDITILHVENGTAKCLWKISRSLLNGNGVVMGGFTASAADIAMAYALMTLLEENQTISSINLNTTFHRPITAGEAVVHATVKKFGKKTAYVEAVVEQLAKRAADVNSSIMILPND